MASKAGTVLKIIGAWALLPAALAALGYYVIGPKLGADDSAAKPQAAVPDTQSDEGVDEAQSPAKTFAAPKIEVSVRKGHSISAGDLVRPKRKKKPVSKPEPSTPEVAPPISGGDGKTVPETIPVDGGNGAGNG